LDLHSFKAGTFMQDGLWYDAAHPEAMVLQAWDKLIARYSNQQNVIAFDLKNEPHTTTWNTGNLNTDWDKAAMRIGNHIQQTGGDRFLIFVEGTASSTACSQNCFWGENLIGVRTAPIKLNNQERLVYSPHCYGPSVSNQPYFQDPSFPNNMPPIWEDHYGFVQNLTGQSVVVGEWGGPYSGQTRTWLDSYVTYLIAKKMTSQFWWCLNPNSGDTGGLLLDDWVTPVTDKLNLLARLNQLEAPKYSQDDSGYHCIISYE